MEVAFLLVAPPPQKDDQGFPASDEQQCSPTGETGSRMGGEQRFITAALTVTSVLETKQKMPSGGWDAPAGVQVGGWAWQSGPELAAGRCTLL